MEDKRIKSALEITQEKAASMSRLTPEELNEQREREYKPRGLAIASRYLENKLRGTDLRVELNRYQGKEGEIVRKAFLVTLFESIGLEDMKKSLRAIDGIQTLEPNAKLEEIKKELEAIFNEFQEQRQQKYAVYEELERERLRGLGVSGSSVKSNLEEGQDWGQELRRIQSEYDSRTNKLREKLLIVIGSNTATLQL